MTPITLLLTEATESLARIQARLRDLGDATITGTLTGPHCRYTRTLPAAFSIRFENELLVTDPCYWTADLPFLYDLQLEIRQGDIVIDRIERQIGLRRLSVRGPHLFVEGKRFVFRAARFGNDRTPDWSAWRETRLAMYVVDPDEKLCVETSEEGVWIIAEYRDSTSNQTGLSHPAVAIIIVPPEELENVQRLPGGPLIGVRAANSQSIATSADVLFFDVDDIFAAKRDLAGCTRPAIAVRFEENRESLAEARSACEQLQRDLAPELNLAGYIV